MDVSGRLDRAETDSESVQPESVREARRSLAESVLLQSQSSHQSEAARRARRRLFAGELSTVDGRFSAEVSEQLEDVVDHHEFLAMLVAEKLIDEKIAMTFYRYPPALVWNYVEPFVIHTRVLPPHYGVYPARHAAELRALSPTLVPSFIAEVGARTQAAVPQQGGTR